MPEQRQRPAGNGAPLSKAGQAASSTLAQRAAAGMQPTPPTEAAANAAMGDNLQVAFVIRVTPTKATRLVVVMCPFCSRLHVHGWPYRSGPPARGWRTARGPG